MKTVYEISEEYRIPLAKLKRLHAAGHLAKISFPERDMVGKILAALRKGNAPTVEQLRSLILNRNSELAAIPKEAAKHIGRMVAKLGNLSDALPADQFPHNLIFGASIKDESDLARFSAWIASIIPPDGCSYQYVAIRAVVNVSDVQFPVVYPSLAKAIRNARKHGNLAGMSAIVDRATVFFQRKEFDL